MSTVQEIEAAIPKLSRGEVEALRAWIDDFLEDQLELNDEVKRKLDESRGRSELAISRHGNPGSNRGGRAADFFGDVVARTGLTSVEYTRSGADESG